ncbi:MAG: hypothetical protein V3U26_00425, partial [Dehalococcoidia bacterium]
MMERGCDLWLTKRTKPVTYLIYAYFAYKWAPPSAAPLLEAKEQYVPRVASAWSDVVECAGIGQRRDIVEAVHTFWGVISDTVYSVYGPWFDHWDVGSGAVTVLAVTEATLVAMDISPKAWRRNRRL